MENHDHCLPLAVLYSHSFSVCRCPKDPFTLHTRLKCNSITTTTEIRQKNQQRCETQNEEEEEQNSYKKSSPSHFMSFHIKCTQKCRCFIIVVWIFCTYKLMHPFHNFLMCFLIKTRCQISRENGVCVLCTSLFNTKKKTQICNAKKFIGVFVFTWVHMHFVYCFQWNCFGLSLLYIVNVCIQRISTYCNLEKIIKKTG